MDTEGGSVQEQNHLGEELFQDGTRRHLGGRDSFPLNNQDSVLFVQAGLVDLFLVHQTREGKVSTRQHIARFSAGEVLFGLPGKKESKEEDGYWGILVVPGPGTVLLEQQRSILAQKAHSEEHKNLVSTWVDAWIAAHFAELQPLPPVGDELYIEGENIKEEKNLSSKECVLSGDKVLWVQHTEGKSLFLGESEFHVNGESLFPMSENAWLQTTGPTRLLCMDSLHLCYHGQIWDALDGFHSVLLGILQRQTQRVQEAETQRLEKKMKLRDRSFRDALTHVAGILGDEAEPVATSDQSSMDALYTACCLVGQPLGIPFKEHPDARSGREIQDPLQGIMYASRVRYRSVELRGKWWLEENGPLLGFLKETGAAVALLPDRRFGYKMINPESGEQAFLTEENATGLETQGICFYRSFPDRALNAFDLLEHGLFHCKRDLLTVLAMGVLGSFLAVLLPYLSGIIFDAIIPGSRHRELFQVVAALSFAAMVTALFQITRSIAMLRVESRMGTSLQAAVWDKLLKLPVPFFREYSAGNLATRANSIDAIREVISGVVITSLLSGIFSISYFVLLFSYSMRLAMWACGLVLFAVCFALFMSSYQLRFQRLVQHVAVRISGRVLQFVGGIPKLRITGTEGIAFALWAKEFAKQRKFQFRATHLANIQSTFFEIFPIICSAVIFYQVAKLSTTGTFSTGSFLAFQASFVAFLTAALKMTEAFSALMMTLPLYESALPILKSVPEVEEAKSNPGRLRGDIELSHIAFRYAPDSPLILRDISIRVRPGEFVAFVGPSGSGKSTIFRLLLGFETPESGTLYFDGQDQSGLDITALRQQIGVVLQNGKLLPGDIFTNIIGSSTSLTLDDAWEAARLAGFAEDIDGMPMGMHTVVSEGGGTLSGGQRQRLMIARAIVKKPNILLMDEATSALDNRTQKIVSESLDKLQATRIVIAHRLSTILHADKICLIEGGYVREQGNYEELMAQGGKFAELARRQIV